MNTHDLVNRFPASSDLLAMLGLERRSPSETVASALAIFAAGLAVGTALGLLFAPRTGEDIRGELGQQLSRVRDGLRGTSPEPVV